MSLFTAYTLVDISNTQETKHDRNKLQFFQQQNLNTLVQTIGLRSQPLDIGVQAIMTQDIVDYGFGKQYHGLHTVWKFNFSIEHSNVFDYNGKKLHHLINDADGVATVSYTHLTLPTILLV